MYAYVMILRDEESSPIGNGALVILHDTEDAIEPHVIKEFLDSWLLVAGTEVDPSDGQLAGFMAFLERLDYQCILTHCGGVLVLPTR